MAIGENGEELTTSETKGTSGGATLVLQPPKVEIKVLFNGVKADRQSIVTEKTKGVLRKLAAMCNMKQIYITSTLRTAEEQAQAILDHPNLKYATPGTEVRVAGNAVRAQGRQVQLKVMTEKVIELTRIAEANNYKGLVSKHCVSLVGYAKKNVIDIGLNSNGFGSNSQLNALGRKFKDACKKLKLSGEITHYISGDEKGEGAFHIEIDQ